MGNIDVPKCEEGISMSVNIAQTSEVIGTVQEKSPAGRPTSGSLPAGTGREPHIPNQYGMLHGYKFMHLKCIQAGLVVTQTTIRHFCKDGKKLAEFAVQ